MIKSRSVETMRIQAYGSKDLNQQLLSPLTAQGHRRKCSAQVQQRTTPYALDHICET